MKHTKRLITGALILLLIFGSVAALAQEPTGVALTPKYIQIMVGESAQLAYAFTPVGSYTDAWKWSAEPSTIISVSSSGIVTGKAAGKARVAIVLDSGIADSCEVEVYNKGETPAPTPSPTPTPITTPTPTPAPTPTPNPTATPDPAGDILISAASGTPYKNGAYLLNYGKKLQISVSATGSWVGASLTWGTSSTKRAKVDGTGLVTAGTGHAGDVAIRLRAVNASTGQNLERTIKLHVAPAVEMIKLSAINALLYTGDTTKKLKSTLKLSARVSPSIANYTEFSWTSKNPKVATVSEKGTVTAVGAGETNIIVTSDNGGRAVCKVLVGALPSRVALPKQVVIGLGKKLPLYKKLQIDGTVKAVQWKSLKPGIVAVSPKGIIKGMRLGTSKVGVKTLNGKTAVCVVRVVIGKGEETTLDAGDEAEFLQAFPDATADQNP